MKNLKRKVQNAVELYKQVFKSEYDTVILQINSARGNQKNEWGEAITEDGATHSLKRELFRIPEKLYTLIIKNLTDDEIEQMDTKEYSRWFVTEFPQFRMTKDN